jgi:hypothetical protein
MKNVSGIVNAINVGAASVMAVAVSNPIAANPIVANPIAAGAIAAVSTPIVATPIVASAIVASAIVAVTVTGILAYSCYRCCVCHRNLSDRHSQVDAAKVHGRKKNTTVAHAETSVSRPDTGSSSEKSEPVAAETKISTHATESSAANGDAPEEVLQRKLKSPFADVPGDESSTFDGVSEEIEWEDAPEDAEKHSAPNGKYAATVNISGGAIRKSEPSKPMNSLEKLFPGVNGNADASGNANADPAEQKTATAAQSPQKISPESNPSPHSSKIKIHREYGAQNSAGGVTKRK